MWRVANRAVAGQSLRMRLLAGTLIWIAATIAVAGWGLASLFRQHAEEQFRAGLTLHLHQLAAGFTIDAEGNPRLAVPLSDPRLGRPYSGLYWQVDRIGGEDGPAAPGILRSRSLWDRVLRVPDDTLSRGEIHEHRATGPEERPLRIIERAVYPAERPQQPYRLIVGSETRLLEEPVGRFNGMLIWSLGVLGFGLVTAAVMQVAIGLRPLGALRRALTAVRAGDSPRVEGRFPTEIQPLVDDFNAVLRHNEHIVEHARTQAGNLAHSVRTPLSILANAASRHDPGLPQLVGEQVAMARRQVDYHLARARAAAAATVPGKRCGVLPTVESLIRVMERLHRDKAVESAISADGGDPTFRGERQDLQEILGNLLDNAWKWAAHRVEIHLQSDGDCLTVLIDDDGPGLAAEKRRAVLARGVRADERVPGTGLGLGIVSDLAYSYGGSLDLDESPLGGLRVRLLLPG